MDGGFLLAVDWASGLEKGKLSLAIVRPIHDQAIWKRGKESKGPPERKREEELGFLRPRMT